MRYTCIVNVQPSYLFSKEGGNGEGNSFRQSWKTWIRA